MGALQAFVRVGGRGTLWLLGLTLGLEVLLTNTLCNRDLVDGTVITRSCSGLKDAVCVNDTVGYILTHPGTCAKKNGVFGDTTTSACLSFTLRTDCEGYTYRPPQNLPACDWTPSINTTEYGHSCFCPQGFGGPECEDDLNEWCQQNGVVLQVPYEKRHAAHRASFLNVCTAWSCRRRPPWRVACPRSSRSAATRT